MSAPTERMDGPMSVAYQTSRVLNAARWARRPGRVQRTPDNLFAQLNEEFHFTLDAASSDLNAKCERHFTVDDDALFQDWGRETVWLNPPYGKAIGSWVRKAWEAAQKGATVVMLLPTMTDQPWFHDYIAPEAEVRFIRGRVTFLSEDGSKASDLFYPSMVVVFRNPLSEPSAEDEPPTSSDQAKGQTK